MEQTRKTPYRRIACNELITPEGQCLIRYVVELSEDGQVERHYALTQELARTEWHQGRLNLRKCNDGVVRLFDKHKPIT